MNRRAFLLSIPAAYVGLNIQTRVHESEPSPPSQLSGWPLTLSGVGEPILPDDAEAIERLSASIDALMEVFDDH